MHFKVIHLISPVTITARPGESITKQIIEEHFFYRLNSEEKWRLCFIAKEHASKEGVALRSIDLVEEVNKCTVSYQNVDLKRDHVGLKCPFIPFVLLRLVGDSDEKVAIAIQRNPFLNKRYEFKEEIVEDVRYVTGEFLLRNPGVDVNND